MEKLYNAKGDILIESNCVFSYGAHIHTYYEMILYQPFDGKISLNGNDFKIDSITSVLVCPSDFHEITVKETSKSKFIKIGFNADVLTSTVPDFSLVFTHIEKNEFIVNLFKEMLKNGKDKAYAKLLINTIIHIMINNGKKIHSVNVSKGYKIATTAAKMLNENFNNNITLQSVAKQLSVAPQYLSAVFKQNLGINFSNYLINLRLQYAKNLILDTQKSLTEICFEVGFSNFSHFSRSFKKMYKASAREYRNMKK